jgi:hypothetical protein
LYDIDSSKPINTPFAHFRVGIEKLDQTVRDIGKVSYDTEEGKELFAKLSNLKEHFHNA